MKLQALTPAAFLVGDDVIDLSHASVRQFAASLRADHSDDRATDMLAFCRGGLSSRLSGPPERVES